MEWGIVMAAAGLFLMVVLILENVDAYVVEETTTLPDFEPEYEGLLTSLITSWPNTTQSVAPNSLHQRVIASVMQGMHWN